MSTKECKNKTVKVETVPCNMGCCPGEYVRTLICHVKFQVVE